MVSLTAKHISECFIKPKQEVDESKHPYYLGPWDLRMMLIQYIQKGLLFAKHPLQESQEYPMDRFLESLKDSLSQTLVHFYPLAGQLATQVNEDRHECLIFVDCIAGPGARFIYATLDMTVSDIVSPTDVPPVVESFFDQDRIVNYDGHTRPLLSVQVTELLDGVFIGCSMNHLVADGTSYWHFWNMWSEIHRANGNQTGLSRPVIHDRFFTEGYGPAITLPFIHPDEFVIRYKGPPLRERFFHFSSDSVARLKAKANEESKTDKISSFQALTALVWRSIVRANTLSHDQVTNCRLTTNNRHRLDPPLSQDYFGNAVTLMTITAKASELLEHGLGWAALLLHHTVVSYGDKKVRDFFKEWFQSPSLPQQQCDSNSIKMISSPRFDMYGNDFGLGKAVAVRSGHANKLAGHVTAYPGHEGGVSVDLEICLPPDQMSALELDQEFMGYVSSPTSPRP